MRRSPGMHVGRHHGNRRCRARSLSHRASRIVARPHRVGHRRQGHRPARQRPKDGTGARRASGPKWARCSPSTPPTPWSSPSSLRLSVPVPAQRDGESEIWIAELGLVGELWRDGGRPGDASSIAASPSIPRSATACASPRSAELEQAFCGDPAQLSARRLHPPGPAPSRPWSASTNCSASISPSSAPPAPASPAPPR